MLFWSHQVTILNHGHLEYPMIVLSKWYADRTRALPVVDPDDRELTISCGSALFNMQLAISYFGYRFETSLLPQKKKRVTL